MKNYILFIVCLLVTINVSSQSVIKGDASLTANIGYPHLFKGITKVAANSKLFQDNFSGIVSVSQVKGINPIVIKGDYALHKMFTLGFNYSFWSVSFNVEDHYNAQRISYGPAYTDSVDIYKIKVSSTSYGIRPVFHFPLKTSKHDLYVGVGLGYTKYKIGVAFSSTDVGRSIPVFGNRLAYSLSVPGGYYFAPSFGYRYYFHHHIAVNFELGFEKGAIVQGGFTYRLHFKTKSEKKAGKISPPVENKKPPTN